jgi:lysine-specific demethylase/histidyl-hydroxylase NO66
MANQGKVIPPKSYTRSGGAGASIADQVADDKVLGLIADGATLVLQALHRNWPPLVDFGSVLASELGHPVQINAYVTPSQNQGFAAHYDTHDVFVLQIAGTKRWLIHLPVLADPLPGQVWEQRRAEVEKQAAGTPLLDVVLGPGDALYLPRGFLHSAVAQGETSIHLTVGIHPVTRYSLLKQLLAEATNDDELRRSLPMALDLSDPDVLAEQLSATAAAFAGFAAGPGRLCEVATRVADELSDGTRPVPISPLAQLAMLRDLAEDAQLRLRPGLRAHLRSGRDGLVLHALDHRISVSTAEESAVKLVLAGEPVRAGDLPGELLTRLLRSAVLVPDEHA